jgi:hypothetical protein
MAMGDGDSHGSPTSVEMPLLSCRCSIRPLPASPSLHGCAPSEGPRLLVLIMRCFWTNGGWRCSL